MTLKQFKKLFPLKGQVTKYVLNKALLYDRKNCIGAKTLRSALRKAGINPPITWGRTDGTVFIGDRTVDISSGNVDMMELKKPTEVIFKIAKKII